MIMDLDGTMSNIVSCLQVAFCKKNDPKPVCTLPGTSQQLAKLKDVSLDIDGLSSNLVVRSETLKLHLNPHSQRMSIVKSFANHVIMNCTT